MMSTCFCLHHHSKLWICRDDDTLSVGTVHSKVATLHVLIICKGCCLQDSPSPKKSTAMHGYLKPVGCCSGMDSTELRDVVVHSNFLARQKQVAKEHLRHDKWCAKELLCGCCKPFSHDFLDVQGKSVTGIALCLAHAPIPINDCVESSEKGSIALCVSLAPIDASVGLHELVNFDRIVCSRWEDHLCTVVIQDPLMMNCATAPKSLLCLLRLNRNAFSDANAGLDRLPISVEVVLPVFMHQLLEAPEILI
mmetsp:Transcript_23633/g.42756  ORF Transcript_23633/g.42756 Transcript_23633/m.42756 type:complete len:251 (-) Transcript_23633:113-865(-)